MNEKLRRQAIEILKANDRGGYTVPTARLYPYQWNWDAGFSALGWAIFDEARAWEEMEKLFSGQWGDGMLPHIVFHQISPDYFPGPEVWGTQGKAPLPTSGISQPPVSATIVRWLLDQAKQTALAEDKTAALYPKLLAHHRWWHQSRDPEGSGLVATYHPWETGRDNSVEWDAPFAAVPATTTQFQRRDTQLVNSAQRPHQHEYQRYIYLVELFRSLDYDADAIYRQSPFKIADVGINAILARADRDLLHLAGRFGTTEHASEIQRWLENAQRAFARLWNGDQHLFNGYDFAADRRLEVPTSAGLLPLFGGLVSTEQADAMAQELTRWAGHARYLVPSLAPDHPAFESQRYWRGPAWSMMNYMIAHGLASYGFSELAERLRGDTLGLTEVGDFHEYFDPLDGSGCGGGLFSWTAAIALWWDETGISPLRNSL